MCTSKRDRKMLTCCHSPGGATPCWPGPACITSPSAGARTRSDWTCRWSGVRSGSRKNAATPAGRASSDRALRRCPVNAATAAGTALAATNGPAARSMALLLEGPEDGMGPQPRGREGPGLTERQAPAWRLVRSDRMANTCSNQVAHTFPHRSGVSFVADQLVIRGAREHNLKDVSLDLPRDSLIVFTGLSGSGKSSLAFDTIFAEGQRRYVESLSAYARQFLGQMDKPDVDFIEGLSPAVSIDQKSTSKNPRSTVGTITEVYDYLRLLYARAGRPHCPVCGSPIERQTPQQIVDRVMQLPEGTRFQVLAPVIRGRKGEYVELFRSLQTQGFSRARVNGETHSLDTVLTEGPKLDKQKKHTIDVVVDRLAVKASSKRRLTDSVETALGLAGGLVVFDFVDLPVKDPARELRFSEKMACPNDHPIDTDDLEPRSFSFNSPFGACPVCHGLGTRMEVDPELVVSDPTMTLGEGAIGPWSGAHVADFFIRLLSALGDELGFDLNTRWQDLPA